MRCAYYKGIKSPGRQIPLAASCHFGGYCPTGCYSVPCLKPFKSSVVTENNSLRLFVSWRDFECLISDFQAHRSNILYLTSYQDFFFCFKLGEKSNFFFRFNIYCYVCVCAPLLSCVELFATPWTVAHKAPLSMEFSKQEYWSGEPFSSPGDLPSPGIKPEYPAFQALTSEPPGEPQVL